MPRTIQQRPTLAAPAATAPPTVRINVFDGDQINDLATRILEPPMRANSARQLEALREAGVDPRPLMTSASGSQGDKTASHALVSARAAVELLHSEFQFNSYDNQGSPLNIIVRSRDDSGKPLENAGWTSPENVLLIGSIPGTPTETLAANRDIISHEVMHGVINSRVRSNGKQDATTGASALANPISHLFHSAVNESWADVLASRVDGDLVIGNSSHIPGIARDLANPRIKTLANTIDSGAINQHDLSSIPSRAAAILSTRIGHKNAAKIWFDALRFIKPGDGFPQAAQATVNAADAKSDPHIRKAIADAWRQVGIDIGAVSPPAS